MKSILLSLLLLLANMLAAQPILNPPFKVCSGSVSTITKIERTPENTKLYIHAIFRPHWWIKIDKTDYIEDVATGKKYAITGSEGIELTKETYLPDSGEMDFVLLFDPLPKETKEIHWLAPNDSEGSTYNISLEETKQKGKSPLDAIKGNWLSPNNEWVFGFYDSLAIMNNRFYRYETIRKKGKSLSLMLKDNKENRINLLLSPQKDGSCFIQQEKGEKRLFSRKQQAVGTQQPETDLTSFFRTDTVRLQGYIDGYDPRLGFETGLIYLSNNVTRKDYPTVITIYPDGRFESKFVINHPIENRLVLGNNWIPFYVEPGQTLTVYLDWEDIMARNRARNPNYPIKNTRYMGPSATISQAMNDCEKLLKIDYRKLQADRKKLSPNQFKAQQQPQIQHWNQLADSLIQTRKYSTKTTHLIRNKVKLMTGNMLFDFLMSRDYYAKEDTTNQVLKIQETEDYYDFLRDIPLNDETIMATYEFSTFINRFEYIHIVQKEIATQEASVRKQKPTTQSQTDSIRVLSFKKEQNKRIQQLERITGAPSSFAWEVATVRRLPFELKYIETHAVARDYLNTIEKGINHPYLRAEAERLFLVNHSEQVADSYKLPASKATDIFRKIIAPHQGKVLFIDFWATTCGPCRGGIAHTAPLREKYKNHPEFQFVYITSEIDSPINDYNKFVDKNLKGEACYRVSETEFNYLRELFQFNGIPHYRLIEKDGSVSNEKLGTYNLTPYLEKRFEISK